MLKHSDFKLNNDSQGESESTKKSDEKEKKLSVKKILSLPCLSNAKLRIQGEKRGREVPGPLKKVLGLLDFLSPGTTGPRDLQGL